MAPAAQATPAAAGGRRAANPSVSRGSSPPSSWQAGVSSADAPTRRWRAQGASGARGAGTHPSPEASVRPELSVRRGGGNMLFQVETTRKSWVLSYNNNNSAPFGFGSRVGPAVLLLLWVVSALPGRTAAPASPRRPGHPQEPPPAGGQCG